MADIGLPYRTAAIVVGEDHEAAQQISHAGKVTRNIRHVVIQTAALQQDIASMKLALRRVGSSDNCSDHFTKLLPLVPFWTHTYAMMGARHLTRRHLGDLGFDPVPHNRHLSSLFGVALSSPKNASTEGDERQRVVRVARFVEASRVVQRNHERLSFVQWNSLV